MSRPPDKERHREERDQVLGRALDELESPEYPPDFLAAVWARVDTGEEAAVARTPRRRRWVQAVAAACVATAVAIVILVGLPGTSHVTGPEPVSAAEVVQKMLRALASGETLQADSADRLRIGVTSTGADEYGGSHALVYMRSDGSLRFTQTDKPQLSRPPWKRDRLDADDSAYDAVHGVFRSYVRGWEPDVAPHGAYLNRFVVTTGYPLGPPDIYPSLQGFDFSAMARALQAGAVASLDTTTYQGRRAWVISIASSDVLGPKLGAVSASRWASPVSGDEVAVTTVDQETCLPVRFQVRVGGVVQFEYRWTNVRIDQPLPDGAFKFTPPEDAEVVHRDAGFRRLSLAQIASASGHDLLLPALLPAGYVQQWAAVAATSSTANGLIEGRDVVAIQYVRGFDGLTFTTRTVADPEEAATTDPVEEDVTWADMLSTKVRLTEGAFAGVTARVVLGPRMLTPHLWAVKGDVMLTVAGSATAEELVKVAESVAPSEP